ncbi:LamB/YcsF family protein [Lacrimispora indolis]|uniref:LamB/YcsF family protein n=1 Tax=Lacrimispora indolis TaxID=69825 RepID=UPI00045E6541|nr:5-oxoprolinase subunit PxpA [Lacrimispora indolis]
MPVIDLNCDLGESFGAYKMGLDEEVLPYVTSANIACGFHGGDPLVMEKTVALCKKYGVRAGAHPGFPDLVGFGRRNMSLSPKEVKASVMYQIGALKAFCNGAGIRLCHLKPHGALYNMAAKDYELAKAICQAVKEVDNSLILLALSGSEMLRAAKDTGLLAASEVFADRAYQSDGSLVPRSREGALIEDEDLAVRRVIRMAKEGVVESIDGSTISIEADSVCVHGDGVKALEFVKKIREGLLQAGIEVKGF